MAGTSFSGVTGGRDVLRSEQWGRPAAAVRPPKNQSGPECVLPNGKRLVYSEITSSGGAPGVQIRTVPIEEGESGLRAGKPEPFLPTKFLDHTGRLSQERALAGVPVKRIGDE